MFKILKLIGKYFLLMARVFRRPAKWGYFFRLTMREINDLILSSVGLVAFISLFMGAVTAIQMAQNLRASDLPVPDYYIGYATKVVIILEFSPTIISLILAGKVGSYIASSIGTMRATEQIDALNVIGINAPEFLILPKIIACVLFNPILVMISIAVGLLGGFMIGQFTNMWSSADFIAGLQGEMDPFYWVYSFMKSIFFAFVIATVPGFYGYYVKGGSLEVGRSSTTAVVWTSVIIIILNLVLTQLMLG